MRAGCCRAGLMDTGGHEGACPTPVEEAVCVPARGPHPPLCPAPLPPQATVYVYELQADGELKVDKLHYSKTPAPESRA